MKARAAIVAGSGPAGTRYPVLRSDPPLLLRPTPDAVQLVGGAAGPLGGDRLRLDVGVEAGARLRVGSAAATVVLPGPTPSEVDIDVQVGEGAHLAWLPEPLVSVRGSRHRVDVHIGLDAGATLRWDETIVLGRTGEEPGQVATSLRIERQGRVLHHQNLELGGGDGWRSPAVIGSATVIRTMVEIGPPAWSATPTDRSDVWAAAFPLADDAVLAQVMGTDPVAVGAAADELIGYGSLADGRTIRPKDQLSSSPPTEGHMT